MLLKNWFCNRRRRDFKEGKICRRCRFFKAPVSEEAHNINGSRPCISYWKLPTVAPPPLLQMTPLLMTSDNLSSSLDESVDRQQEQQTFKPEIDGNLLATDYNVDADSASVVPTAFSLTFQPTYNFQQPIFNSEVMQFITTSGLLNDIHLFTFSRMLGINNSTTDNIHQMWQFIILG